MSEYWKQNDKTEVLNCILAPIHLRPADLLVTASYLNAAIIITCGNCRLSKTDKAVYGVPKIKLQMGQCLVPQTK